MGALPGERAGFGQAYLGDKVVPMSSPISLANISVWFPGPGKPQGSPGGSKQPNEPLHGDDGAIFNFDY